jgi:sec-independent protein translocase protein TatC
MHVPNLSIPPTNEDDLPLLGHLKELKNRLLRVVIALVVVFVPLFMMADTLYTLLAHPLLSVLPNNTKLIATGTLSPFMIQLQIAMYSAIMLLVPYILFELWGFVAPGLYKHEKRAVVPIMMASIICFLLGVLFCFYIVVPTLVKFMTMNVPEGVAYQPDVSDYLSTTMGLFVTFGFAFEFPVAVVLLAKLGIVSYATLLKSRRYVIVGIFIVAAVVTPPDVMSQLLLAIPLIIFYELALLFIRLTQKTETEEAQ